MNNLNIVAAGGVILAMILSAFAHPPLSIRSTTTN
jgi:hypothetical protein